MILGPHERPNVEVGGRPGLTTERSMKGKLGPIRCTRVRPALKHNVGTDQKAGHFHRNGSGPPLSVSPHRRRITARNIDSRVLPDDQV